MDTYEIFIRLAVAAFAGAALGLNRDLHGKPTGVRTLGLVGLGSAIAVLAASDGDSSSASRVVQGIVTGIGFLGAGVIIRNDTGKRIHGLTTAACVWLTATIGAACGIAEFRIIYLSLPVALAILVLGGPLEKFVRRKWPGSEDVDTN